MLVRLLGIMAGPSGVHNRGELIQVSDAEGQHLIDSRQAVAVDPEEAAKAKAAETATSNAAEKRETAEANPHRRRRVKVD